MFSSPERTDRVLGLGAYLGGAAVLGSLVLWLTAVVAGTGLQMLDARIIDGSGRLLPAATEATASVEPAQAPIDAVSSGLSATAPVAHTPTAASTPPPQPAAKPAAIVAPTISTDNPEHDYASHYHNGVAGTFRTYCVRLCDGYFWPISFSTTSDRFDADEATCRSTCGTPARLFVHPIPGGGPGTMVSVDGLPYSALKNAFLFRTRYDAQCRCQAQPWEQQAKDQHRFFAVAEAARKGDRGAATEARQLSQKLDAQRKVNAAWLEAADSKATRDLAALAARTDLEPPRRMARERRSPEAKGGMLAANPEGLFGGFMRLGATEPEPVRRGGFVPASGNNRHWRERVFGGN